MKSLKMDDFKLRMISFFVLSLAMVVAIPFSSGYTCEEDVYAISSLHAALGYPLLPGWTPFGGDPCLQGWQGVQCVGPNITAIVINDANLEGELGDKLGNFSSIITLDLSNNHIGGSIPKNLPLTLRQFFLSSNHLTGSIPSSLADLTLLSDMSLNENFLNGELPDSFQFLSDLVNLDISSNNLSGPLPPSFTSLSSLTTFHIQDNHISGTLDVLQDLPLINLDIENNLFSGPVPEKLWNIPNFKSNGNPFNTTVAPSPAPTQAWPSLVAPIPSSDAPAHRSAPTPHSGTSSTIRKNSTVSAIAYVSVVVIVIIAVLLALFCALKLRERLLKCECIPKRRKNMTPKMTKEHLSATDLAASSYSKDWLRPIMAQKVAAKPIASLDREKDYLSFEKVRPQKINYTLPASVKAFSVASLQQYTNYFGEDHLIRSTHLGRVYVAELFDGKLLTVLKLNNLTSNINAEEFEELVLRISKLRHQNIIELVGFCSEFGQRLLIFKYFSRTNLHDLLYDFHKKRLSWNARIQIALAAARAVEYLHEFCKPPVILRNLEPSNILIDDDLAACISECGLSSFLLSNSLTQFSGDSRVPYGYEAPEIRESGSYTDRSDVYSFGVFMLELLTGRQPYESSQSRASKHLVRWASPQLYDINALSRIVDPSMDGVVSLKSLSRFADIIGRCIQQAPEFRPSMSQIVQDISLVLKEATL